MFPFLDQLIQKVREAQGDLAKAATTLGSLADYLESLRPNDFRDKPSDLYRPR